MTSVDYVLSALREELVDAGLVRRPSESIPAGVPPCHIEPVEGAPAPGEREGIEDDAELVLSLFASGVLGEGAFDAGYRRRVVLDLRYRAASSAAYRRAMALDAAVVGWLIRPATNYGHGFTIGVASPLLVHEAAVFGGFGRLGSSREAGYDAVSKLLLEVPA